MERALFREASSLRPHPNSNDNPPFPTNQPTKQAVSHGRPLVGVKGRDGVVLVGRKALESSKLQVRFR